MIPVWLFGLGARLVAWLPTLLSACLEVLIRPAAWLLLTAAILGGYVVGARNEKAACATERQTSIDAARAIDKRVADEAHAAMQQQVADARQRLAEANDKVMTYEIELASRPNAGCTLDDRDVERLDGLQQHRVPGRPAGAPTGGGRDPRRDGVRTPR